MTGKPTRAMALLRIFCAMLLLFAGLAHRPVVAGSLPPQGMMVYVLPDGSVADLCLSGKAHEPEKFGWRGCEACRIAAGVLLPEPAPEAVRIERASIAIGFVPRRDVAAEKPLAPGASPRGPPGFFA